MPHPDAVVGAAWLRSLPSLTGRAPALDLESLPDAPAELFARWIADAVNERVPEPHAMTVSTVDGQGMPDARTLILKAVGTEGWAFAGKRDSAMGSQLAAHPAAALSFWWQPLLRAVRLRGNVREASAADSAADLAARSVDARRGVGVGEWVLWRVIPESVEFWQGATDRNHLRLRYRRESRGWVRTVNWSSAAAEEGMT